MFNIQRKNLVDKRKMKTAKDYMEIHTVHGKGEEWSSISFGTGSCIHEIDYPTLKVTQWLIEK